MFKDEKKAQVVSPSELNSARKLLAEEGNK